MMMTVAKNDYNIVVAVAATATTTKDCLLIPLCPKSKKNGSRILVVFFRN